MPQTHKTWAEMALPQDIVTPPEDKIAQGWVVEIPTHTTFNWHMNRTDRRLAELEARLAALEQAGS